MSETWYVRVDNISPDPHNPRKSFNTEDLHNLAQSIKTYGLVQPLVLREAVSEDEVDTKYVLVAGERRWRACGMLKLEEIPCTLLAEVSVGKKNTKASLAARREIPVSATAELALVENIQRQNLTPIEEARAFDTMLRTETSLNAATLAQRIGLTAEYIRLRLRLLELPEDTQNLIGSNKLPLQHANILHALVGNAPEPKINAAALDAARKRLPAKTLERVVRGMLDKSPRKKYTREEEEAAPQAAPAPRAETIRSQMFAGDLNVAAPAPAAAAAPRQSDVSWQHMPSDFLPPVGQMPVQMAMTKTKDGHKGFVFAARDPDLVMRCWEAIADIVEAEQDEEELDV
jgi:ParB family chromosome partitioning protein